MISRAITSGGGKLSASSSEVNLDLSWLRDDSCLSLDPAALPSMWTAPGRAGRPYATIMELRERHAVLRSQPADDVIEEDGL
jgi:hypothetical protein